MADAAVVPPPGSSEQGFGNPDKSSRGASRGDALTPGSAGSRHNAVKKWKRQHEQNAMLRLSELRSAKKIEARTSKENARKIARKIPVEVLAKEWLSQSHATIEMRAYMVDKVLPTVILGVEKLLNEVDARGLTKPEAAGGYDPNFNPINFLAQYLMRNNPRYSNFSEASPYVRGLRQIAEELKAQLFDMEDNRLARIKAEAKRKREERELQALMKQQERERRQTALMTQFQEWNVPTDNNRVELSLLQNTLRSFVEVAEQFPPEIKEVAKFGQELEPTDETGLSLSQKELAQYLSLYIENLPTEVFEQFMEHMSKCATAYHAAAERENRRIALTNLFIYCDHSGIGLLDRHRILSLFEQFWDSYEDAKKGFRNPRKWPVVEVDEAEDSLSDEEDNVPAIPQTVREYEEERPPSIQSEPKPEQPEDGAEKMAVSEEGKEDGSEAADKTGNEEREKDAEGKKSVEETTVQMEQDETEGKVGGEVKKIPEEKGGSEKETDEKNEGVAAQEGSAPDKTEQDGEGGVAEKGVDTAGEETAAEDGAAPAAVKSEDNQNKDEEVEGDEDAAEAKVQRAEQPLTTISEEAEADEEEMKTDDAKEENDKEAEKGESAQEDTGAEKADKEKEESEENAEKDAKAAEEATDTGTEKADSKKDEEEAEKNEKDGEKKSEAVPAEEEPSPRAKTPLEDPTSDSSLKTKGEKATSGEEIMEVTDKEKENAGQDEKEKDETGADPELAKDVDISGEMAKSSIPPRVPDPTGRLSITFADGTAFEREKTGLTANSGNRSQSQMSAFDESNLNVSQFVQLTETFLGESPVKASFDMLLDFLKEGYEETEDEKIKRLMKARKEAISANHKVTLDALFDKWDNDGSGYLDLGEVEQVMLKYKEGQEEEAITKAQEELKKQSKYHDSRLTRREFRTYVGFVVDAMPGADAFDYVVEFLTNNVERSYAERVRGEARKKWLQQIINAAETSGISLEPIYKAVFQALYRDAEAHGGEKRVSASLSLLERNTTFPDRGDVLLRYVACTPEDADYVLNRALYRDMNGISFAAVDSGKPVHVPRVNAHGNIHFWNTDRMPDQREGSFIVVPLKDRKKRVFGVLGIDTLCDPHSKAIFITHEIQYFQGVAQTFSVAYHMVDMRRKLLRITESAISWIKRRSPHVAEIMVYMVEPGKSGDFVLRRMMTTDNKGFPIHIPDPPVRLERKDNLFRDYLFKSVDNSETVTADAYGNRHLAFPLRNDEGKAIAVVDISIGTLKKLPPHENKEAQRMLRLLQQAHKEITREFAGEDKMQVLDAEKNEETRMDIMFDRLMLMELRENVSKLDSKAYAELKAYNSPPEIVLHILRASLAIFYADLAAQGEFNDWNKIKTYINGDFMQKVQAYDPTADENLIDPSVIEKYLKEVPHGEVAKHGSLPAQYLYNWVFVCISLIEHTRKMRDNADDVVASQEEQ